eukprot:10759514-Karenia_brevis.AAC.1
MAEYDESQNYCTVKKAPVDAEICVDKLPNEAQAFLKAKGGSREKEWKNMINASTTEGGPAVVAHRGKRARELKTKFAHRLVPSRWLEKWKEM